MFASLFILLYLGHLLADYPFQTDHQAAHKADCGAAGWRASFTHAATHIVTCGAGLLAGVVLLDLPVSVPAALAALVWIGATHAFIDRRWPVAWWMDHARQTGWAATGGAAHVDQTAHLTALLVAALFLAA
ncbi:DUF3307 domain-containing protein [Streptomyces fulvorobeus]|uniref:DUF3307 domain-containing protein n=1 Tax=Streptomyces fulvorobeus TaxID=284028 RepID=A0A7J0C6Q0_9ACTN|nr:DUF3307 domain-containing protein [Streptomyces fulvorobeus]NYE41669.1 hypothetical protein [Streptomyces fulvorobeus]GFM98038.1 hypothetical protein Sfulv_28490 [Streptomyces fulvorobeus]